MRKLKKGITEQSWGDLSEDHKLYWKFALRFITFVVAIFTTKTNIPIFDWAIGIWTWFFPVILLESQRSYQKYSIPLRRAIVSTVVFIGSWSATILGLAIFLQAVISAAARTFSTSIAPELQSRGTHSKGFAFILVLIFAIAIIAAAKKTFRDLRWMELIYHIPNKSIKDLFVKRKYTTKSFPLFAHFEISIVVFCYIYSSSVATVAKIFIDEFRIILH
jgi:hypothetical protein